VIERCRKIDRYRPDVQDATLAPMRQREPFRRRVCLLASVVVLLGMATETPAEAAACSTTLTGINLPALPLLDPNYLSAVSARTPSDMWAVGGHSASSTLILHSDGTSWSVSNNPGSYKSSDLYGVAAFSASDAWAVGEWAGYSPYFLYQHWDGGQWSYVSDPTKGTLRAVAGTSGSDLWAVGDTETSTSRKPAARHYDGGAWSTVPTAGDEPQGQLNGVASVSSTDVWAVGDGTSGPLIQHWNGAGWSSRTDASGDATAKLFGVSAVSGSNVWAVGSSGSGSSTLIEHWNGALWSVVPSPSPGTQSDVLTSVSAHSGSDVWAAGTSTSGGVRRPLLLHWNGSLWKRIGATAIPKGSSLGGVATTGAGTAVLAGDTVDATSRIDRTLAASASLSGAAVAATPNLDGSRKPLVRGVEAYSDTEAWAVGTNNQPVAEHWNGTSWTATTVPSASSEVDDVKIFSPNNVWAVGSPVPANAAGTTLQPRIMNWDGGAWTIVPAHVSGYYNLQAIDGSTASDIWAVGDGLVEHYDGTSWHRVTDPLFGTGTDMFGVLALGPKNVWIATQLGPSPLLHWNGTAWSAVAVPSEVSTLFGIEAIPGGGFWAVGDGASGQPIILRRSGGALNIVPGPAGVTSGTLLDVGVVSSTDAWSVGYRYDSMTATYTALTFRWSGSSWSAEPQSPPGSELEGVAATATGRMWAGGIQSPPLYQACGV
jgi:hypothetical protein